MPLTKAEQKVLDKLLAKKDEEPDFKFNKALIKRLEKRLNQEKTIVVMRTVRGGLRLTTVQEYTRVQESGKKLGKLPKKKRLSTLA